MAVGYRLKDQKKDPARGNHQYDTRFQFDPCSGELQHASVDIYSAFHRDLWEPPINVAEFAQTRQRQYFVDRNGALVIDAATGAALPKESEMLYQVGELWQNLQVKFVDASTKKPLTLKSDVVEKLQQGPVEAQFEPFSRLERWTIGTHAVLHNADDLSRLHYKLYQRHCDGE